ncbi:hypothetical protein RO3G_17106 [Lichtheimia corymbifera JMRC:FSU:9682]|uniref:Uncharacterized protein n=1 Tax=Lichtheimia corymbifera JMRC:FSU:9682 TaxID=1263082 RepID=A0A068RK83_9FUNG|nr:hypothetical protein RO3G_17106 [Lichtheimia corymbifera JMRC:FSU:9682]
MVAMAMGQQGQWVIQEDFELDVHRFSHIVSTHLLFDHVDTTMKMFSRTISNRFREEIQIDSMGANDTRCLPLDVQLLKGQISGAIGSYIEDKLPSVWNEHAKALDKTSLEYLIEHFARDLCPPSNVVLNQCLAEHGQQLLSYISHHIAEQLRTTISHIVQHDIPHLFETTQTQVASLLLHFNHPGCHLELNHSSNNNPTWLDLVTDMISHDIKDLLHDVGRIEDSVYQFAILAKTSASPSSTSLNNHRLIDTPHHTL